MSIHIIVSFINDFFVDVNTNTVHIASSTHETWDNEYKIIATTDTSLNLPQLSEVSIKLIVNYYNENGNVPGEVEIIDADYETVDITIPKEKLYTREEVINLVDNALASCDIIVYRYPDGTVSRIDEADFKEWINKNL